ncbi:hypothetical protein SAMN05446927_7686 [Caballeronia arationis]|uniref:Uncharacterized protein n=1 Tax=Caballeronia arationis TaxID=1777142 RepID=A0A7Z7IE11_9BURK|nr:hypothetical protein SAMN05446927_7686 [Caballeronia arationis]
MVPNGSGIVQCIGPPECLITVSIATYLEATERALSIRSKEGNRFTISEPEGTTTEGPNLIAR